MSAPLNIREIEWGRPPLVEPNPWQANDAVHAALAMRRELEGYNKELGDQGLSPLAIGVGLHRGTGVAGLVGSRDLMQFAFVGPIVNFVNFVKSSSAGA